MFILSLVKSSSKLAWLFIKVILELNSLIFFTSNNVKINSNLFFRSKEVSDLPRLSKLNLKKFSKNNATAWPWLILNKEVKG